MAEQKVSAELAPKQREALERVTRQPPRSWGFQKRSSAAQCG
ncbi:MAG: hypothetical protein V8T38_00030 [Oscillospiraceae bacterium]